MASYALEDIREFMVKRTWLAGPYENSLVTKEEYVLLRDRQLDLPAERARYLRAFADGWRRAKA